MLGDADILQQLGGEARPRIEQGQEQGAGTDIVVAQGPGLLIGDTEHLIDLLRGHHLTRFDWRGVLVVLMDLLNEPVDGFRVIVYQSLQDLDGLGVPLGEQRQQDKFRCQQVLLHGGHFRNSHIEGLQHLLGAFLNVVLKHLTLFARALSIPLVVYRLLRWRHQALNPLAP